jgi:hypothetical protein
MRIEDSLIFLASLDWVKLRCLTGLILRDTFPLRSDSAKAANRNPGQNVFGEAQPICGSLEGPQERKTAAKEISTVALGLHFSLDEKNGPPFRDPFFNAWSGKRDSHLASDTLKSKGFLLFLKQEWT